MQLTPGELTPQATDNLTALKAGREYMAQQQAAAEVFGAFNPSHVENRYFAVASVKRDYLPYDEGRVGPGTLLAVEALGIDSRDFLSKTGYGSGPGDEVIVSQELDGERLKISRYSDGVTYHLESTDSEHQLPGKQPSDTIRKKVTERLMRSPAHNAWLEAGKKLVESGTIPETVETEPFNFTEDPIGTLVFLEDIGIPSQNADPIGGLRRGADPKDVLAIMPSHGLVRSRRGEATVYSWGETVRKELEVDSNAGTFIYRAKQNPTIHYLEKANQVEVRSLPFVESDCAKEISERLDQAGLMFHPTFQVEMMKMGDAERFGSIYTGITREIAKWVDDPQRTRLSELLVAKDPDYSGINLLQDYTRGEVAKNNYRVAQDQLLSEGVDVEADVRSRYQSAIVQRTDGEASEVVFTLINDVLARDNSGADLPSDLPVTADRISFTKGSCFDVVAYYVGAAAGSANNPSWLKSITVDGVPMLEKNMGTHTFMATEPMTFNGVKLPKGSLFSKGDDGKWAFMRLTPFTFDDAKDQVAFGSEISKLLLNEREAIQKVGDLTIQRIIQFSR